LFVEALRFTAAETGFAARLIEKDYFCSLVLEYLAGTDDALVFKGGTCLAKVHASFYRLSEDLDFAIPMPIDATRQERSRRADGIKQAVTRLPRTLAGMRVVEPLRGANNSLQYIGSVAYQSLLSRQEETITLEIGLREPLATAPEVGLARSILLDPISHEPMMPPVQVLCLSVKEAYAEKFRAALSRREVAIRDFFDIDYAVRTLRVQPDDMEFIALVREKLAVPGNEPVNVSDERRASLRQQIGAQLRPVLRDRDFRAFDLDRAFGIVSEMADRLSESR